MGEADDEHFRQDEYDDYGGLIPPRRRRRPNIPTPEEAFGSPTDDPPADNGFYKGLIDDIDNEGSRLTSWELDFVDDMMRKLEGLRDDGHDLTDYQREKIEEIYDERL